MIRPIELVFASVLLVWPTASLMAQNQSLESAQKFLRQYCVDCHSASDPSGDREFETLDLSKDHLDNQLKLQEVIDQLTLGAMPPEDAEQPDKELRLSSIRYFTRILGAMRERTTSTGGKTVLRRLTRREYRNTVRDLLGIDTTMFDPTIEFPADNLSEHFDNIGDTLVTSGYLLEKYLDAADICIEKALPAENSTQLQLWSFKEKFPQQSELDGAHKYAFDQQFMVLYDHPLNDKPEGAYGPLPKFASGVPADGIYEMRVLAQALHRDTPYKSDTVSIDLDEPFRMGIRPGNTALKDMVHTQPIQPLLAETAIKDDELAWYTFRIPLDKGFAPRLTFENGIHDVRGAYGRVFRNQKDTLPSQVRESKGIVDMRKAVIKFGHLPQIRIHEIELRGPIDANATTSAKTFLLGGASLDENRIPQLLKQFASKTYRRAATDDEVAQLLNVFESRVKDGLSPFEAYKDALKAALCSPSFLYLSPPEDSQSEKLTDHGIAQRLSYFLTSTMPDDSLRKLADEGKLSDANVLRFEALRLLKGKESDAFVADFLDSWLNLRALGSMPPDEKGSRVYYSAGLEPEMKQETRLFMRDLIARNASTLEFLRADYSFANRDLAKLYGVADQVPVDEAEKFHRVRFANKERGGLLGQASILTVSANGIETSPVIRGIWLMETVLGTPVPPPPDSVPALDPDIRGAVSIREQLAKHRESEACNQCHRKFDPLGFALEGFDPIGRKREFYDTKRKTMIDTSGVLPGGDRFSGPAELREIFLKREEFFVRTVTSRLFSHALGRRMEAADRPAIDKIVAQLKISEYPLPELIASIVTSDLFQRR
jgi:Protein of unknown function (DUF1592)/Protein of unknown function (DUF1588)/Protein of unknown function (DUF1587)/Protein of unknown function (DUF1585)/Protein of unknown function (DUF1595)/Planctomycete cytochrome C